jgi:hypothetical protein
MGEACSTMGEKGNANEVKPSMNNETVCYSKILITTYQTHSVIIQKAQYESSISMVKETANLIRIHLFRTVNTGDHGLHLFI